MKKSIKNIIKKSHINWTLALILFFLGCEDIVEINTPRGELVRSTVFSNEETAQAALYAIYSKLQTSGFASGSLDGMMYYGGFSSDELRYIGNITNSAIIEIYSNAISSTNTYIAGIWSHVYQTIYTSNALLEGVRESDKINEPLKSRMIGQALFIRAFCHFYLVNIFGDVPYIKSAEYQVNSIVSRDPVIEVFKLIEHDLIEARMLLASNYEAYDEARIFPIQYAADALLARLYLYQEDWGKAEESSSRVIESASLFSLVDLADVFKADSREAIWQLASSTDYTWEGATLVPGPWFEITKYAVLSNEAISSFDDGDTRRSEWVGMYVGTAGDTLYYPFKYKSNGFDSYSFVERSTVFRLAEQYLIRAEARVHLGRITDALYDINAIRSRAKLPSIELSSLAGHPDEMLNLIGQERRIELMAEGGHRWFDLKRLGIADEVLSLVKPGWRAEAVLYPIPESELSVNSNLYPQNPGY